MGGVIEDELAVLTTLVFGLFFEVAIVDEEGGGEEEGLALPISADREVGHKIVGVRG